MNIPIVVLGAGGYMGQAHVRCLLAAGIPSDEILGVEPDTGRRVEVEKRGVKAFSSLDQCASMRPQIAIIAAPSPVHRKALEQCAAMGIKNILCEKPLVLNAGELDGLAELGLHIYVGYLINFSPVVERSRMFMAERGLLIRQVNAMWGNNWAAKGRWIGPNLYEELPHALVTALCLIGFDRVRSVGQQVLRSFVPSMRSDVAGGKAGNDTSLGSFIVQTGDGEIPISILSSFNFFEERRIVDISMTTAGSTEPELKACLEFDVQMQGARFDRLRVIEARTNAPVAGYENLPFACNKLELQLKAALDAFAGKDPDPRLVGFEQAAMIVRLLDEALTS